MDERERTAERGGQSTSDTTNGRDTAKDMTAVFTELARTARVESAFGQPYISRGSTVIPVAEVMSGLGFGTGIGTSPEGTGSGGGGGGGARSRPVALVVIDDSGVRVEPVLDLGRLYLAGLAVAGFAAVWLLRFARTGAAGTGNEKLPTARAFKRLVG